MKCLVSWRFITTPRSFSAKTKLCQEFADVFLFSVHFILRTPLAERLASVTADTNFKVFDLTRLRVEPILPAFKANALNHYAMALT